MILDMESVLKELCIFFDKAIPDEEVLTQTEKHLSFQEMKGKGVWVFWFSLNTVFSESSSMKQVQGIMDDLRATFGDSTKDFQ